MVRLVNDLKRQGGLWTQKPPKPPHALITVNKIFVPSPRLAISRGYPAGILPTRTARDGGTQEAGSLASARRPSRLCPELTGATEHSQSAQLWTHSSTLLDFPTMEAQVLWSSLIIPAFSWNTSSRLAKSPGLERRHQSRAEKDPLKEGKRPLVL